MGVSEFNELMLDGVICQSCGVLLGGSVGYPQSCPGCEENHTSPAPLEDSFLDELSDDSDEVDNGDVSDGPGEVDVDDEDLPF